MHVVLSFCLSFLIAFFCISFSFFATNACCLTSSSSFSFANRAASNSACLCCSQKKRKNTQKNPKTHCYKVIESFSIKICCFQFLKYSNTSMFIFTRTLREGVSYIWKPAYLHGYYLDSITDVHSTYRKIKWTKPCCKSLQLRWALICRRKSEAGRDVLPAGVALVLTHVCTGTEKKYFSRWNFA